MTFNEKQEPYTGQKIIIKDGVEIAPAIFIYDDVIDNSQQLIDFALSFSDKWRDSRIGGHTPEGVVDKKIRNTRIFDATAGYSNDIIWFDISQKIWAYANNYALGFNIGFSHMEDLQLLHYSTEEGFYRPHADCGPGHNRIFSGLLYLNDVDEGGETYFDKFDVSVTPKAGRLALFPANYVYTHEAKTPKSNDKFALVTWFKPIP